METGKQLGPYTIRSVIGKGGMGEVYLAEDTRLGRKVAVKILPPQHTQDPDRVRRFEQEAETASRLNHPSIITIHEIGRIENTYYIVTEYVEGETLRERMRRAPLSLPEFYSIAIQISSALVEAHAANIVHRDIKPENVMVRPDGLVKVLDFGLAKLIERQPWQEAETLTSYRTDPGTMLGTLQYMSPEQARGQELDGRSDIFSLGAVLYEMGAGRSPFDGGTTAEVCAGILERDPAPLSERFPHVSPELEKVIRKALSKKLEDRYQSARELREALSDLSRRSDLQQKSSKRTTLKVQKQYLRRRAGMAAIALLVVMAAAAAGYFLREPKPALTERDTILLADFLNSTGDPVFDGTLKQGLAVQLEQSPFLDIFPDVRLRQTLRLMGRPQDERVTRENGREICLRAGLKAFIAGSIASLGTNYVIGLEAVNAETGEVIAREQVEATTKEEVLKALGSASSKLREHLGESLTSIQKFDAPLEVTTSSLEALKAYSVGYDLAQKGRYFDAIPFFRTAVQLDPDFGYAYDGLATSYNNLQLAQAIEPATKAFALRDRVTEIERFRITYFYYLIATGELDKALETVELYRKAYPRDYRAASNFSSASLRLGLFANAVAAGREGLRLNSPSTATRVNLSEALIRQDQYAEAKKIAEAALQQGLDSSGLRENLFWIGFITGDAPAMKAQADAMSSRPDAYRALGWQAQTAAFHGEWQQSRDVWERALRQLTTTGARDLQSRYRATALFESAVQGRCEEVETLKTAQVSAETNWETLEYLAAAFSLCDVESLAEMAIAELTRRFPNYTLVKNRALPVAQAALALQRGKAQEAIEALEVARRYESASEFRATYFRGLAYLQLKSAQQAGAEFQQILNHRGYGPLSVLYPLAQLGYARSLALTGNAAEARKAYETFLNTWKNANSDLLPLRMANREYRELTSR